VQQHATGWMVWGFTPIQTSPEAHPASCIMGTGGPFWGWSNLGMAVTTHSFLLPQLEQEYSYTSTLHMRLHDML